MQCGEVVVRVASPSALIVRIGGHVLAEEGAWTHSLICIFFFVWRSSGCLFTIIFAPRLACCLLMMLHSRLCDSKSTLARLDDATLAQLVVVRLQAVPVQLSLGSTFAHRSSVLRRFLRPLSFIRWVFAFFVVVVFHIV